MTCAIAALCALLAAPAPLPTPSPSPYWTYAHHQVDSDGYIVHTWTVFPRNSNEMFTVEASGDYVSEVHRCFRLNMTPKEMAKIAKGDRASLRILRVLQKYGVCDNG